MDGQQDGEMWSLPNVYGKYFCPYLMHKVVICLDTGFSFDPYGGNNTWFVNKTVGIVISKKRNMIYHVLTKFAKMDEDRLSLTNVQVKNVK